MLGSLPYIQMLVLMTMTACQGRPDGYFDECRSDVDCEIGLTCVWFWEQQKTQDMPGLCTYPCSSSEDCHVECRWAMSPAGGHAECRDGYCFSGGCE